MRRPPPRRRSANCRGRRTGGALSHDGVEKTCLIPLAPAANVACAFPFHTREGPAKAALAEQGWRVSLLKVYNPTGIDRVELRANSPNALPLTRRSSSRPDPKVVSVGEVGKRFLDVMMFNDQPLVRPLSGLEVEYRIIQLYSRDAGRKEATLAFTLQRGPSPKAPALASSP